MEIEFRSAKPRNDRDNRPVHRWGATGPACYEQWYAIVHHQSLPVALWFRHSLLRRQDGPSEARLWAVVRDQGSDPPLHRIQTRPLGLDKVNFDRNRFGMTFGDTAFFSNGTALGTVPSDRGDITWDLTFNPNQKTFRSVGNKTLARLISKSQHLSPNSRALASGILNVGDRRYEFADAALTQGHTFGRAMQDEWVWGACPRFDGAPNCGFEAVATRRGGRVLMSFELTLDGRTYAFNRLRHLKGRALGLLGGATQAGYSLGRWAFSARRSGLKIEGHFTASRHDLTRLRYRDVDGNYRFNCNQMMADLELTLHGRLARRSHLHCSGRATFELVSRQPACGTDEDFLPPPD